MAALHTNFLNILKTKLERDFVPHLPELIDKTKSKVEQDKKQLSRAFSAFAIHKLLGVGIVHAGAAVVDDFDDNGLDAIYYHERTKTLYLVQTKLRESALFDQDDAIRFRNGICLLLDQKYDKFNKNVTERAIELDGIFNEAERIQLVVAYVGSGISEHAKSVIKALTEDADYHEVRLEAGFLEYSPEKVQGDLLAEKSVGIVNDSLLVSKCQRIAEPQETYFGVVSLNHLVDLHKSHPKALYERNIRYFLGSHGSEVNKAIQETLRTNPDKFFYLNNGVTALADHIGTLKGLKSTKRIPLKGFSIINGAQTISAAAEFVALNPNCDISDAKVMITIIRADSEGKFGRSVTRARNHQNPVSTGNFASLDPRQEDLRRELSYLGYSYHYRPEATPRNSETVASIITMEQAMKALALFEFDSRYPYWLKNEVTRFKNAESNEYKALFTQTLTGTQLVNKVKFFRFVCDVLASNAAATKGAEGLFYRHGVFVVAAAMAKKFRDRVNEADILKQEQINQLLSAPLDQCRQTCWDIVRPMVGQGRSVLTFFQNQGNTVRVLDSCMAATNGLAQTDAYQALKRVADKKETFPQERLFRFLATQASQI